MIVLYLRIAMKYHVVFKRTQKIQIIDTAVIVRAVSVLHSCYPAIRFR